MYIKRIIALILALSLLTTGVCAVADGGWSVKTSASALTIDKQAKRALTKAMKEYTGYELKPLALLGTQMVAGMNYCFLCYGNTVTQKPVHSLCKAYVYEDLNGKAEITGIKEIPLKGAPSSGWKLSRSKKALKVKKRAISALRQATAGMSGATYKPLLVFGRAKSEQDGYCLLCRCKKSDRHGSTGLSIVILRKTKGKYAIRRIEELTVAN